MKTTFLTKALALAGVIFLTAATTQAACFTRPSASGGTYSSYVYLAWSANSYANYGYYVYRTTTSKYTGAVRLGRVTGRSCIDTSAKIGTKYWYWISPIRKSGSRLTYVVPKSGAAATSAQSGWRKLFVPTPSLSLSSSSVTLTWSSSSAAKKGYYIYRGTSSSFSYASKIGKTKKSVRKFVDKSAYPGRTYYYWVLPRGPNTSWYSSSKWAKGWRKLVVPTPKAKWYGNAWSDPSYVYWSSTYGAQKYKVYRGRSWSSATLISTLTGTALYDYGVPHDGYAYYYWVCPVDIEGDRWYNSSKNSNGVRNCY